MRWIALGIALLLSLTSGSLPAAADCGTNLAPAIPVISVEDCWVLEGDTGTTDLVFSMNLSGTNCELVTVDFQITPGIATAGIDYYLVPAFGVVEFPPGETNRLVEVQVIGDSVCETDETVFITLSNPVGGHLGRAQAVGTIINDDLPSNAAYSLTAANTGYGTVSVTPFKPLYSAGQVVQVVAIPARWHAFTQWNDGVTLNPRSIVMSSNASFTATFIAATPMEALDCGGVSRVAPVGMPMVVVDGVCVAGTNASARGRATISLSSTFPNDTLLFTLDGSDPGFSARLYEGPFVVQKSQILRAIAYSWDFNQSVQSDPVEILILPTLTGGTAGGGSVSVDPAAGAYWTNEMAMITATPAAGWTFLKWLGDAEGTNPTVSVNMNRDKCVQAVFGTGLSNFVVGSGSIVSSPSGALYPYGTKVRLTAVPLTGNYFAFWANAASGTNNPLNLTVTNANSSVAAVFASLSGSATWSLTVVPNGFGQVTASPRANRFVNGTNVTLTAAPDSGQVFLNWSGDASGSANPLTVTMNHSRVITANFTKRPRLEPVMCGGVANGREFQLLLTGDFGETHVLEATTNLVPGATDWTPVAILTNSFGTAQFNDASVTNRTRRFFRTMTLP